MTRPIRATTTGSTFFPSARSFRRAFFYYSRAFIFQLIIIRSARVLTGRRGSCRLIKFAEKAPLPRPTRWTHSAFVGRARRREDDAMAAEARAPGGADRLTLEISMDELERDGYDTNPHDARGEYIGAPKVRTNARRGPIDRSV